MVGVLDELIGGTRRSATTRAVKHRDTDPGLAGTGPGQASLLFQEPGAGPELRGTGAPGRAAVRLSGKAPRRRLWGALVGIFVALAAVGITLRVRRAAVSASTTPSAPASLPRGSEAPVLTGSAPAADAAIDASALSDAGVDAGAAPAKPARNHRRRASRDAGAEELETDIGEAVWTDEATTVD